MSRDKQIKELADGIFVNCQACLLEEEAETIAKYVIEKEGYRKATEVSKEIFDDLKKARIITKCIMNGFVIWDKTDAYFEVQKKYLGSEVAEELRIMYARQLAKDRCEELSNDEESEGGE